MKISHLFIAAALWLPLQMSLATAADSSSSTSNSIPSVTDTSPGNNSYYSNRGYGSVHAKESQPSAFIEEGRIVIPANPIYFPPTPPPLGQTDYKRRLNVSLAKFAPPSALGEDVYEFFYAPLSTLLFTDDLSNKQREKLASYHTARRELLRELREKLESLQTAEPSSREASLATLARDQAPRLAALEANAEELRANFARGSALESGAKLDDPRWESQIDEIKMMRAAAGFQEGLSANQRRLLREIEMELGEGLRGPTDEIALSTPGPFISFSPETSRIRLPADLPADLAAKIDAYKNLKSELKKELRDSVYQQDRTWFYYKRVSALKSLAEKQAPSFASVEKLAEEIRLGLAPLPNPAKPPALPLPAALASRIDTYHQQKSALQAMMVAKQEEIKNALPDDRVEYTRLSDSFVLNVIPNRQTSASASEKRSAIIAALAAFNQEQTRLYLNLAREKEAVQQEIMKTVRDLGAKKSIDQLLREFSYAFKQQEAWEQYREYEIAVFQPGLSPAQRQLLFGAAVQKLDLPLAN